VIIISDFNFSTTKVAVESLMVSFDRTWKRVVAWFGLGPGLDVLEDERWQGNKLKYVKGKRALLSDLVELMSIL